MKNGSVTSADFTNLKFLLKQRIVTHFQLSIVVLRYTYSIFVESARQPRIF